VSSRSGEEEAGPSCRLKHAHSFSHAGTGNAAATPPRSAQARQSLTSELTWCPPRAWTIANAKAHLGIPSAPRAGRSKEGEVFASIGGSQT